MKLLGGSAAVVLLCLAWAVGQPAMVPAEDFAILPWSSTPGDAETLDAIRECGFNLAGFVSPDSLDAVKAAGLQGIVSGLHVTDPGQTDQDAVGKQVAALVAKVGNHPAVYGYYLRDEPSANMFPALAAYTAALRQAAPQARAYINLFPNYANEAQLGTPTYAEHLERYIATVKPPFVSYDHYALMDDGTLRGGYFANLEAVRAAAMKHELPFWNIVLSNAHFRYAEPTEGGLRFQAFTTLAYGARGISYFTYFTPQHGNYRLAPIDQFGNKTATWEMLRRVNLQIHALAPTLVKCESVGVFHHPNVPEGGRGIAESRFVAEVGGGDVVVGEFKDSGGSPMVMIVNKDLHQSIAVSVRFKQPGRITQINNYTGKSADWGGEGVWLASGQGALLRLSAQ